MITDVARIRSVRPCAQFQPGKRSRGKVFCRWCEYLERFHDDRFHAPRFATVSCSACGREFHGGNEGYSHCDQHVNRKAVGT